MECEKGSTYYYCGLIERDLPLKELTTLQIKKAYEEHQVLPKLEEHLLIKIVEHDVLQAIDPEIIAPLVYYENRYFTPTTYGSNYPIKLPTNIKVPGEIIELIKAVTSHPKTTKLYNLGVGMACRCPLLNRKEWTHSYAFEVDEMLYNYGNLLIDECTVLNIHPSQAFVDAMRKFLKNNPVNIVTVPITQEKKFKNIVLGQYIDCYGEKYAIKNFYIKTVNEEILKNGYYLVFGSRFGYHVVGHASTVTHVPEMSMYRLNFYDKIINACDIDPKFNNCLLFNILKYVKPSIKCDLVAGSGQPTQEILIEYEPTDIYRMPNETIRTYVKWYNTHSDNVLVLQPDGSCGSIYDTQNERMELFTGDLDKIPRELAYMAKYVNK
jgi:hypothetical protein